MLSDHSSSLTRFPTYFGVLVLACCISLTFFFWWQSKKSEHKHIKNTIQQAAEGTKNEIEVSLTHKILALQRLAYRWETTGGTPKSEWSADVRHYLDHYVSFQTIKWVAPNFRVRRIEPLKENESEIGLNLAIDPTTQKVLAKARDQKAVCVSAPIDLVQGGKGFFVCVPIFYGTHFEGFILGVFQVDKLLIPILNKFDFSDYFLSIADRNQTLYQQTGQIPTADWSHHIQTHVYGTTWSIVVVPCDHCIEDMQSMLPETILSTGILLSMLATLLAYQFGTARHRTALLEKSKARLLKEIVDHGETVATLRQSEDRFRQMVESTPNAIVVVDHKGQIVRVNAEAEILLGYTKQEAQNLQVEQLIPQDLQTEHRRHRQNFIGHPSARRMGSGQDLFVINKEGTRIPVEIGLSPIDTPEGQQVLCSIVDLTQRKNLEKQLRQSQKMEAIGQLAGGIAHDFNNLLTAINGYCDLILQRTNLDIETRSDIEEIHQAGTRAASLTYQLLAFSRKQVLAPKVLNLNHIVSNLKTMLSHLIGKHIQLKMHRAPGLANIEADEVQIEQMLINLSLNARDAMPEGGMLTITTANTLLEHKIDGHPMDIPPGNYVKLTLSDTGIGMAPDILDHIFEPFFTTKEETKGTGLGLSTVYGIIAQSGGYIAVTSHADQGTIFYLYLPAHHAPIQKSTPDLTTQQTDTHTKTILMVEDDMPVRNLVNHILKEVGYTILVAEDANAALRHASNNITIDLLLTDVLLPDKDGKQLYEELKAQRPNLRVLYMSGHTGEILGKRELHGASILYKPFSPEDLLDKLNQLICKPRQNTQYKTLLSQL